MSRKKKVLLAVAGVLTGVLAGILILPLLFVDRIEERVRAEIEEAARVQVDWSDVGLGLLRSFPHPTFTMRDLTVVGTGRFDGDTLAAVGDFRLALDGPSVVRAVRGTGPLVVRSVRLEAPRLRLRVHEDGLRSWDVMEERADARPDGAASGRGIAVSLRSFELRDGDLLLDNAPAGVLASVRGLDHSVRGDFSRESLTASMAVHADAVTYRFAGATYLSGVALDFSGDFDVDMAERTARLTDNELRLNDLVVRLDGSAAAVEDGTALDLVFAAPATEFGQVLSLVPVVYGQDFAALETSGTFTLDGEVDGTFGPLALPAFSLRLNVADGYFRYPDLPLPARAISVDLAITNPGGDVDSTVVDLSAFHVEIGDETLDARLALRTPASDPEVDVTVRGTLDLADVARTVKLDAGAELGGVVVADASLRARRSDVDSARYDRIEAAGTVEATGVTVRSEGLRQPVDVNEARLRFTPQTAELQAFDATLGSSDLQATGRLDNVLAFALGAEPLTGSGSFTSRRFVLDEWRSDDEVGSIAVPALLDLTLDGSIGRLELDGLEMANARGRAMVREERLTLEGFSLETLGGRVAMDGFYETTDPARPTFSFRLGLDSLEVAGAADQFLTVQALAPVARYARGTFSSTLNLSGAIGEDMAPVLDVLEGDGSLATSRLAIEGFPLLDRLGETLRLQALSNPTVQSVRSSIRIQGGRLVVDPFRVGVGGLGMTVAGSNGIDQSMDYALTLAVPRTGLADAALTTLASRAGPLASRLATIDTIPVTARVTGTVTQPSLDVGVSEPAQSAQQAATDAAAAAVQQRIDAAEARADSGRAEARERAQARADSIVADAERRAEQIRAEASRRAEQVRAEGDRAADALLARATNPLARAAAEPAAQRLRQEADERAADLEREADEQATALVDAARERADRITGRSGGGR